MAAGLGDPDGGISGESWQWQSSDGGNISWSDIAGAASSRYTPAEADVGRLLRASVTYADGHGGGKGAASPGYECGPQQRGPVANDDAATTAEDEAVEIDVLANDEDAGGDTLTVRSVTSPANGTVAIAADGRSLAYTPAADFNGEDRFDYTATDGAGTDSATVTVTVTPINDDPVASNGSFSTLAGTPVNVDLSALTRDADDDPLTYSVEDPAQGAASLSGTVATYAPEATYAGRDAFNYRVSDGQGGAAAGVLEIWVTVVPPAREQLITPVSIQQVAGSAQGGFVAERLIDGSGLSAPPMLGSLAAVTHSSQSSSATFWMAGTGGADGPYHFDGSRADPVFEIDLGGLFDVKALLVWGAGAAADGGSGAAAFGLEFSADGGMTYGEAPETVGTGRLLAGGHEELPIPGKRVANHVRLTVTDNAYGRGLASSGGDRAHLGELRFLAGPPPVQATRVVTPAGIDQTTGDADAEQTAARLIDGSGLSAVPLEHNVSEVRHSSDYARPPLHWRTAARSGTGYYFDGAHPHPQFNVRLGRTRSLTGLAVWGLDGSGDEATDFELAFSTDGGAHWGRSKEVLRTSAPLGDGMEMIRFNRVHDANAVRLTITDNAYGRGLERSDGGGRVGLGEIRFLSGPEPLSARQVLAPAGIGELAGVAEPGMAVRLIDGSGLSAPPRLDNLAAVRHGGPDAAWATAPGGGPGHYFDGGQPEPLIELDLGASYCLTGLAVWGADAAASGDEAADFRVELSDDGGLTFDAGTELVRTSGPLGAGNELLAFSQAHAANRVRITITDNALGRGFDVPAAGERVELGEIRCLTGQSGDAADGREEDANGDF